MKDFYHNPEAARRHPRPTKAHSHHGNGGRDAEGFLTYDEALPAVTHWGGELKSGRAFVKDIIQTKPYKGVTVLIFIRTSVKPAVEAYSVDDVLDATGYYMEELRHKRIKLKLEEHASNEDEDVLTLTRYDQ